MDPVANFAKVLVQANAIKPAVGGFATLLGLAAIRVADQASSPLLYWITAISGGAFLAIGVSAVAVYLIFPLALPEGELPRHCRLSLIESVASLYFSANSRRNPRRARASSLALKSYEPVRHC
jgi:hypothetical protein